MWNLIKKDFFTISRDRSELLVLLAMPMILISILGFALGGLMFGTGDMDAIPVALIIEDDFDQEIDPFRQVLLEEGIPEQAVEQIVASAGSIDPLASFQAVISDLEMNEVINLTEDYDQDEAEVALKNSEIAAVITIPEEFSYQMFTAFFLEEDPGSTIELLVQDHEQIQASIINTIVTSFIDQYNLELSIAFVAEGEPIESPVADQTFGAMTYLSAQEPVSAFQYYAVGMAVMFALYVASTISANAFKEKYSHIFARLMITGARPLHYLLSKAVSGTMLTMIQLLLLFVASSFTFKIFSGMSVEFWLSFAVISIVYSITVGALAALLTAIALQFNSDSISGIFSGGVVVIFAFIGGSMIPVEQISQFIHKLGNWTPNGAIMTAYLQIIQGFQLQEVLPLLYRVLGMAILLIIIAVAIFPKRRLM